MAQKFFTTVPRYVDGKYVVASPDYPALVAFPDDLKIKLGKDGKPEDRTLIPVESDAVTAVAPPKVDLIQPFAQVRKGPPGKLPTPGKRPSDMDPTA